MACAYYALVPAAGGGARFGGPTPKQYQLLHGRPMLEHSVRALAKQPLIQTIFIVLAPGDAQYPICDWRGVADKVCALYCGGPTRAGSVFNGLLAIHDQADDEDWLLVHDAARPCVTQTEIERLIQVVGDHPTGGLLALPLADTLKRADAHGGVDATVPREGLWRALTPQMFRYRLLIEALHAVDLTLVTDESAAVERLGLRPRLVAGDATNIKVTYPADLLLARELLRSRGDVT